MAKDASDKFEPTEYNDAAYAAAFLAQLAAVIGWVGYAAAAGKYQVVQGAADSGKTVALLQGIRHGVTASPGATDSAHYFVILLFMSLIVAVVWAAVWMLLLKTFPVQMVKVSLIMLPVVFAVFTVYVVATGGSWFALALFTLLSALIPYFYWDYAEYTGSILKAVIKIYDKSPLIYGFGFGTIALQAIWFVVWILAVIPLFVQKKEGGSIGFGFWLLLLSLFWGQQVISNILYVSAAGVVARFYFGKQQEEAAQKSFGQACTNLFGSICFGSLLIAIIQTLREMCKAAQQQASEDGNMVAAACACVAECFLSCLESLVQLFNDFAFVYVAIYGIPFMDAAKKTFDLITSTDALISDNITNIVTFMGALAVAFACAGFNGFSAWRLQLSQGYIAGAAILGFFAGFAIMIVVSRIVEGGATTMIVSFCEEPDNIDDELRQSFSERKGTTKKW